MTMGPEPMRRILCRSVRRGMGAGFLVVVPARDSVALHIMADLPASKGRADDEQSAPSTLACPRASRGFGHPAKGAVYLCPSVIGRRLRACPIRLISIRAATVRERSSEPRP